MSPLDRPVPPPGEEIHLPGASLQPVLLAAGITTMLLGVTIGTYLVVAGFVLSFWVIVRWIVDTRRDIGHLPEDLDEQ